MNTFMFVWGFIAFSILGFKLLPKTEAFAVQDFESNFNIVDYPEEFLPDWAANEVRSGTSRVFRAPGKGRNGSTALGVQPIASFNAQIYIKTSTIGLKNNRISFFTKTEQNGSGNRPVYVHHFFSETGETLYSEKQMLGDGFSFPNANTDYVRWEISIPQELMERESVTLHLEVSYGEGFGTAARWFMDDFIIHGLEEETEEEPEPAPDILSWEIYSVETWDDYTLSVKLNQPVGQFSPSVSLDQGYGVPRSIAREDSTLLFTFADYLFSNQYTLSLSGLHDLNENTPDTLYHTFDLETYTPFGSIIINEFMADPNPKGLTPPNPVLPTAANDEYIELYNRMDKPIRLKGFTYNGGQLEDTVIEPNSYVLLTSPAKKEAFNTWGTVAAATGFRTLPNGSGQVLLTGALGEMVDSLSYDTSWYGNSQKSQGGWSLERINPYQACSDKYNWAAADASTGGTPGGRNSVYSSEPDSRPFQVEHVLPLSANRLEVRFSKYLLPGGYPGDEVSLSGIPVTIDSLTRETLWLTLAQPMLSGRQFELDLSGFVDCYGQSLVEEVYVFVYDTDAPRLIRVGGMSETEVLLYFDEGILEASLPDPSAYSLTPHSGNILSAQALSSQRILLTLDAPLPLDMDYLIELEGVSDTFGNVMPKTSFSFYWKDMLDTVYFISPTAVAVRFKKEVDPQSALHPENYALNRGLGSPMGVVRHPEDSLAYQLIYSRQFPVNVAITVEMENIRDQEDEDLNTFRKSFTWDTRAISVADLQVLPPNALRLKFNKGLDEKWAMIPQSFSVDRGVGSPKEIQQLSAESWELSFDTIWEPEIEYQLSIQNLRDLTSVLRLKRKVL